MEVEATQSFIALIGFMILLSTKTVFRYIANSRRLQLQFAFMTRLAEAKKKDSNAKWEFNYLKRSELFFAYKHARSYVLSITVS